MEFHNNMYRKRCARALYAHMHIHVFIQLHSATLISLFVFPVTLWCLQVSISQLSHAKQKSKSLTAIKKHACANRNIYTIQACRKIQHTLRPLLILMICTNLHHIALAPSD